jgi:hypothetical protein
MQPAPPKAANPPPPRAPEVKNTWWETMAELSGLVLGEYLGLVCLLLATGYWLHKWLSH